MTEAMVDDALVTDADREAADALDDALGFLTDKERPLVLLALARHRLAGVAAGLEEAVTYLRESAAKFRAEAVRQGKRPGPLARSFDDAASAIEEDTAIRQRGE